MVCIMRQEKGDNFDGTAILGRYRSPDSKLWRCWY